MSVGKELKKRRLQMNMTQKELSLLSGVKQPTISAIENEINQPLLETITILSQCLNCSVQDLMGDSPQMMERDTAFNQLTPSQRKLLDIFEQLNETGKKTLLDLASALLANPDLKEENIIGSEIYSV